MSKTILISGATGKQGGSTIDALLASNPSNITILAVTRDASSKSAQKLAAKSDSIKLVQGDFNDIPALFKSASEIASPEPIWGVLSVQVPMGKGQNTETEEKYGKALVDEALKAGVKYFVYASVERGGDDKSWVDPTPVPHFISKHRIELHLRDAAAKAGGGMGWTILRPVAFMDNFVPGFQGKMFATWWRDNVGEKPLQIISVTDIGWFAAQAFLKPQDPQYRNRAIGLAGDELTYSQMENVFKEKTGSETGTTFSFLGSLVLWAIGDMGKMFHWFKTDGFGSDIQMLRRMNPDLMDLATWLEKKSGYETI